MLETMFPADPLWKYSSINSKQINKVSRLVDVAKKQHKIKN